MEPTLLSNQFLFTNIIKPLYYLYIYILRPLYKIYITMENKWQGKNYNNQLFTFAPWKL